MKALINYCKESAVVQGVLGGVFFCSTVLATIWIGTWLIHFLPWPVK